MLGYVSRSIIFLLFFIDCSVHSFHTLQQHSSRRITGLQAVRTIRKLPIDVRNSVYSHLSLDRSLIPSILLTRKVKIVVAAAVLLFGIFIAAMGDTNDDEEDFESTSTSRGSAISVPKKVSKSKGSSTSESTSSTNVFVDILTAVKLLFNIALAKMSLVVEILRNSFSGEEEQVDLKEWSICQFDNREAVYGPYSKYRFKLESPDSVLPLYVGQELVLCSTDSKKDDMVVKESFFPVSPPSSKGYFEIIVSSEQQKFEKIMRGLRSGDEVAFKGGQYRMRYDGKDDPITFMSFFASGLGVTAALQILRSVLPEGDSTVADTELLWVNESVDDYLCEKDVDRLEYKFIEKCSVTRLVQKDLASADLLRNKQLSAAVSAYDQGRIAVVCVPEDLVENARQMYLDKGYPDVNILTISV